MTSSSSPQATASGVDLLSGYFATLPVSASVVSARSASQPPELEFTPLRNRLQRLLDDLPEATKRAGLPLHAITERLRGRVCSRAHPGEVGTAFRELGWRRRRCWRGDQGGFRALWYPPA